ncbi:MAG: hypothetical protein IIW10_04320, partial [Spirochaetaceae bacterium]|nr:hypothetical protein [Spirochaetaceae bacterium]
MSKIYSNKGSAFKAKLSKFLNRLTGLLRPFDPFGGKGNRWNLAFFISHRVKIYFFQIIFIVAIMRMPLCQDQIFLDSNKMLRMHRFETETFQVNRIYGDFSGSIRAADKYYCEKTFDNTHRLSKEIFWIKNDNIELDSISSYFYESETSIPSKKEQIIFSENKFVETTFNEKNQPLEIKVYKLDDTKTRGTSRIASYSYGYDSQNRIVEEVFISEDNWQERRTYNYTNKSTQPDRKIFENNFLVLDVTHKNNKDRTEIIYFEDDFSVEKIYKDNAKKTEIFRHKGKIIRTRDLENDERFAQLDSEVKKNDEKTAATSTDKASDGEKSPETENPIEEREAQKAAKAAEQAAKEAQDAAKKAAEEAEAAAQKAKA